jgi:hypothetical protein
LDRRLGGAQNRSGRGGEEKNQIEKKSEDKHVDPRRLKRI